MSNITNLTNPNPNNNKACSKEACQTIKQFYGSLNYSERENFETKLHNYCIELIRSSIYIDYKEANDKGPCGVRYDYTKDSSKNEKDPPKTCGEEPETCGEALELNLTAIPEGAIVKAQKLKESPENNLKALKGICTLILRSREDTLIYKISLFFYKIIGIHLSYSIAFLYQTIEDCETILNSQDKNAENVELKIAVTKYLENINNGNEKMNDSVYVDLSSMSNDQIYKNSVIMLKQ